VNAFITQSGRACALLVAGLAAITPLPEAQGSNLRLLVGNNNPPNRILEFDGYTGQYLRDFVRDGAGGLNTVQCMTLGPDRNVYVCSWANHTVKRYDLSGNYIDDFVKPGAGGLQNPDEALFGPDGHLYVSNRFSAKIKKYDGSDGHYLGDFVYDSRLYGFVNFTFGPDGNIYAGMFNPIGGPHKVLRFSGNTGKLIDEFASKGQDAAYAGLTFGGDGNLYAVRMHSDRVELYDGRDGHYLRDFVKPGDGGVDSPRNLVFGPADGDLYVGSQGTNNILRYDGLTGEFRAVFTQGGDLVVPTGLLWIPEPDTLGTMVLSGALLLRRRT
jgi:DNA-binding beta-propeller fold protein YncE